MNVFRRFEKGRNTMLDDVSTWHCVGICFFSGSTCQQPLIRDLCEILFLIPAKPVPDVGGWGTVGMTEGRPGRSWPAARACHSRESGNLDARAVRQERGTRVGVGGCFVERRKDLGFPLKTAGMTEWGGNGRGAAGSVMACRVRLSFPRKRESRGTGREPGAGAPGWCGGLLRREEKRPWIPA